MRRLGLYTAVKSYTATNHERAETNRLSYTNLGDDPDLEKKRAEDEAAAGTEQTSDSATEQPTESAEEQLQ